MNKQCIELQTDDWTCYGLSQVLFIFFGVEGLGLVVVVGFENGGDFVQVVEVRFVFVGAEEVEFVFFFDWGKGQKMS